MKWTFSFINFFSEKGVWIKLKVFFVHGQNYLPTQPFSIRIRFWRKLSDRSPRMICSLVRHQQSYLLSRQTFTKEGNVNNNQKPQTNGDVSTKSLTIFHGILASTRDRYTIDLFIPRFWQLHLMTLTRYHHKIQSLCLWFSVTTFPHLSSCGNTCFEPPRVTNELASLSFLSVNEKYFKVLQTEPVHWLFLEDVYLSTFVEYFSRLFALIRFGCYWMKARCHLQQFERATACSSSRGSAQIQESKFSPSESNWRNRKSR